MATYSVFTKPWSQIPVPALVDLVASMGFDAIEFPLRDGAQVSPDQARQELPRLARALADGGIRIDDVASIPREDVFAACADSGIGMIRVMFMPPARQDYLQEEEKFCRQIDGWIPLCERYGVRVGLQMHCGNGATNTAEMMRIVSRYHPRHIGAIWDAAHSGLAGEACEQAIDLAWSHLALVNFKNAHWQEHGRGSDGAAAYSPFFCPGPDGQCPWPRAVRHLRARGYAGTWCMPAEYDDVDAVRQVEYAKSDLVWLKSMAEGNP